MNKKEIQTIDSIIEAISSILKGEIPQKLYLIGHDNRKIKELVSTTNRLLESFSEAYDFIASLAQGKLNIEVPVRNNLASQFKQLHSNLKHLTWQVQQVAIGDYNQRVDFLGDFSDNFNSMIATLKEKKQVEKALRESEEKYYSLFRNSNDGIFIHDLEGNIIDVNQKVLDQFGYTKSEMFSIKIHLLHPPEALSESKLAFETIIRYGSVNFEADFIKKNGPVFTAEVSSSLFKIGGKQVVQGIVRDITDRKQAELALKQSEERYRSLVENTMDGYFISEIPSGQFLFLNQRSCSFFGYTMEEGLKLTVWDVMSPEDHQRIEKRIQARLEGKPPSSELQAYTAIRKDGSTFRVEISTSTVAYRDGLAIQGLIRDITERERLENQLRHSKKMEAIGTLAGGIAHDFNNLLMGIQGRTSLMLMDSDTSHSDFEHLKEIEDYVKSAADLTKQLLSFARSGKYEVKPTDLNELIKKSSEMFGRTKKEITIYKKSQKDIWAVDVDQGQMEQVLLNLYVNAWQSMPVGGDVYIQTKNVTFGDEYVKPFDIKPGKYVKISVTDTGVGMDKITQERIFDPFFTTKEMGRGTGLGLASAYGIIKNHNGFINVYSEKGEGTTFNIYIPASEKEIIRELKFDKDIIKGDETVILVDDEDMIIDVGKELLKKMGYKVLIAKSGKAAVELYEANKDEIDMVILDMIMPEIGGGDTYDRLKEINPNIKALLSSGYSINGQATEILERGCNGFIQKPFNIGELSKKMREILDKD